MTKNVTLTWLQKKQFVGTDSGNHSVVISGRGDDCIGLSPSELLLLSLASCSSYDVVGILEKKRARLNRLQVHVAGENAPEPPWQYTRITMEFVLHGKGLKEKDVAQAIHLSETKYCSVAATIRPTAEIITSFRIIEDE
ncbi:MAG: OsmC family protein [Caldilineales bacterium]